MINIAYFSCSSLNIKFKIWTSKQYPQRHKNFVIIQPSCQEYSKLGQTPYFISLSHITQSTLLITGLAVNGSPTTPVTNVVSLITSPHPVLQFSSSLSPQTQISALASYHIIHTLSAKFRAQHRQPMTKFMLDWKLLSPKQTEIKIVPL